MGRRQAKKILRRHRGMFYDGAYSRKTFSRAQDVWIKCWRKYSNFTPGHRRGRWDPAMPMNPNEVPF